MSYHIPELLAPVGGFPQLSAAVQNGADAVYMGGPLFNARMKADNFGVSDMQKAIDYAHIRNVKAYITVNTLIRDDELFEAFSYIHSLYKAGADAVILQDMGLARLVREYLPDLPMHLSTQGTVYNKWALDTVRKLGFCRIVPARELSLTELEDLTAACHRADLPCEVEVFVHGALCMCYSGQCQMSRILGGAGGRSGNRGLCAQPCRLPYENEKGEKSFLLSPKDICLLEDIPQLCRAGIDSIKIEGRLKSPQYVALVTSVYRKYLDQYQKTGDVKVQADDRQKLMQIFNRGGFSKGYFYGNPGRALLSGDSPKNWGTYVGTVQSVRAESTLVDVKPDGGSLSMGDGVEIYSRKTVGNVISYLKPLPDGCLRIGDIKGKVNPGDRVYKVTDKRLLAEAERSYASDFIRRIPVEMKFVAELGKLPVLSIREAGGFAEKDGLPQEQGDLKKKQGGLSQEREGSLQKQDRSLQKQGNSPQGQGGFFTVRGNRVSEKAIHKPLDEERVKNQLCKLGNTAFAAEKVTIDLAQGISVPVSVLNDMRRQAVRCLIEAKCQAGRAGLTEEKMAEIKRSEIGFEYSEIDAACSKIETTHSGPEAGSGDMRLDKRKRAGDDGLHCCSQDRGFACRRGETLIHLYGNELPAPAAFTKMLAKYENVVLCIPLALYMDDKTSEQLTGILNRSAGGKRCRVMPYILNVSKGNLDRYIEDNFWKICKRVADTGILIGNLGWIEKFQTAGVQVYGDYGLNVYNRQSVKAFREIGVEVLQFSHEAEMSSFGNIPLMITEHPISAKRLTDRKGQQYTVLPASSQDKYLLFLQEQEM